jgi:hypothetical protein
MTPMIGSQVVMQGTHIHARNPGGGDSGIQRHSGRSTKMRYSADNMQGKTPVLPPRKGASNAMETRK